VQNIRVDDKLDQKERFHRLASLVDLKQVTVLEFYQTNAIHLN
jgi:hypothetical protein